MSIWFYDDFVEIEKKPLILAKWIATIGQLWTDNIECIQQNYNNSFTNLKLTYTNSFKTRHFIYIIQSANTATKPSHWKCSTNLYIAELLTVGFRLQQQKSRFFNCIFVRFTKTFYNKSHHTLISIGLYYSCNATFKLFSMNRFRGGKDFCLSVWKIWVSNTQSMLGLPMIFHLKRNGSIVCCLHLCVDVLCKRTDTLMSM